MTSSGVDSRALKKRKASSDGHDAADCSSIVKSSKFWFHDGSVVLQTPTKQYRIHSSVLSAHSSVFEGMFQVPQPEGEPTIEGCPIIPVVDASEDWDTLLGVLYHSERMYLPKSSVLTVEAMLAFLRLGEKYNFDNFETEALDQLKIIFPDTLAGWKRLLDDKADVELGYLVNREFRIVRALEDLRIQTALPMAYFICICGRSTLDTTTGKDIPDGPAYLSQETRNRLLIAKQQILEQYPRKNFWPLWNPLPTDCESKTECGNRMRLYMANILLDPEVHCAIAPDDDFKTEGGLCAVCRKHCSDAQQTGRQFMFNALPSFFDLPPWGELRDF
ncbi:hypothetical protein D9619_010181 [Psilocybe cf. subviscida]|uniref:BTB domain-containing protein n=1 Tax=Psilocybe cf. subviscida TaxID=2480587 RepID=A0A8H5ERV4_9AGAR|nr:hypothetical protein D9619_010181 [Psilocybe cf. subviscida]